MEIHISYLLMVHSFQYKNTMIETETETETDKENSIKILKITQSNSLKS
jgi:hypothetical protein